MDERNLEEEICEEILRETEELKNLKQGSEEHSAAVKSVAELYKLELERQKIANEEADTVRENKREKLAHWLQFAVGAAGLIIPQIFYAVWLKKGFKFEETGTFTSQTFRGLIREFRPFKK